jgi:hypothetical protein
LAWSIKPFDDIDLQKAGISLAPAARQAASEFHAQ